jgi:hypothetical protein
MSDSEVVPASKAGEIMESIIVKGDLSKLTAMERAKYYSEVCVSIGLNPLTQPLEYITLNGKLTLYARKNAAEQLRKVYGVSLEIVQAENVGDLYVVRARATDRTGRTDEDMGAVPLDRLKGEALSNAMMKAITKAKRRVTLSICGLGFLDETEVDSIPNAHRVPSGDKMARLTAQLDDPMPADMPDEIDAQDGVLIPPQKSRAYELIAAASTLPELMSVGDLIKSLKGDLGDDHIADLRGAFAARKQAIEDEFFAQANEELGG